MMEETNNSIRWAFPSCHAIILVIMKYIGHEIYLSICNDMLGCDAVCVYC